MQGPLTALAAANTIAAESHSSTRSIMHTSLHTSASPHVMVKSFHQIFGVPAPKQPVSLSVTDRYRRLHFILSEFLELIEASGYEIQYEAHDVSDPDVYTDDSFEKVKPGNYYNGDVDAVMVPKLVHVEASQQDPIEMLDALGDIVYVAFGFAIEMGFDLMPILREIHASNLTKLGPTGRPIVNGEGLAALGQPMHNPNEPDGKILKGPNYMKPQLARILGHLLPKEEGK